MSSEISLEEETDRLQLSEEKEAIIEDLINGELITSTIKWKSPTELVIAYTNQTDDKLIYGTHHILEFWNGEEWIVVDPLPGTAWSDIGIIFDQPTSEETINLESYYDELATGKYRDLKEMNTVLKRGTNTK